MFLNIQNVQKSFKNRGQSEQVLKDIDLHIKEGEFVSLLGPSGCGKSTLLSIVAGLVTPNEGNIYLDDKKITKPGKDRGMVFQQAALFPWLSVEENVMFPLRKEMKKNEAREVAHKYLKLVQLSPYTKHSPHELSGGMQQRVAIARALAMNPRVLLMDEPFGALDEQTRMRLHVELETIWLETKKTILFVTHSIQEAVKLSDRIIVMGTHPGTILKDLTVNIERPREKHIQQMAQYEETILELLKTEIDKVAQEELQYALAIKRIVFFAALFGLWELIVRVFDIPKVMMPAPTDVVLSLQESLADGSLMQDLGASFTRLLIGLAIALTIGVLLGILLAKSKTADDTLGALILSLQSIPSIVWLPLAIMWFGLNEKSVIFIVVLGATIVMTINMRTGIKNVAPLYIKAAQTMGSGGIDLFFRVVFPASIPYAVTGFRLAWAFAWRALMAGELLSSGPGLGYTLKYASDFGRMDMVMAIMIVIGVIGVTVDLLIFQRIEKNVMKKWGLEQSA